MASLEDNQTVLKGLIGFFDAHPLSNRIPLDPNVITFAGGEFSHNWQDIFDIFYAFKAQFILFLEQTIRQKVILKDVTVFVTYEPIIKFCLFYTLTTPKEDLPTFVYIPVAESATEFEDLDPFLPDSSGRFHLILGKKNDLLKTYLGGKRDHLFDLEKFIPFLLRRLGIFAYLLEPFPPKIYPENWRPEKLQPFIQTCKRPVYQTGNLTACRPFGLSGRTEEEPELAGFRLNAFLTTLFYMFRDRIVPADYISCLEEFPDQVTGKVCFFDPNQEEWRTGICYLRYIEGRYEGIFIGDDPELLIDGTEVPLPEVCSIAPVTIVHLEKFSRRYRNRTAKFHNRTVVRGTYRNHKHPVIGLFKTNSSFPIVDLDFITVPFVLFDQLEQVQLDVIPVNQVKTLMKGDEFSGHIVRNGCLLPIDGMVEETTEKDLFFRLDLPDRPVIRVDQSLILQSDQVSIVSSD
jgi:hypothetical protein